MSHRNRQQLQDLGLWDDEQEAQLLAILNKKDENLELERARVPDQVWELEHQLMLERCK